MTSSSTTIKAHARRNPASTSDRIPLCRSCKKNANTPNHTVASEATTARSSTTTLTDHKLALFEAAPVELEDVEYKDFLMAKTQCKELNTNWKRVREDELEEWYQDKKSNNEEGLAELHPLSAALQQAGMLSEDSEMAELSPSTTTRSKRSSSGNRNFRSRSTTRAPSSSPPTPVSTAESVETTANARKDVDSLNVGRDKKCRSASRACNSKSNELSEVTLTALLNSTDYRPSFGTTASSQQTTFRRGQLDPGDLQISETVLGEGQLGIVRLGFYKGLYVACKSKRQFTRNGGFHSQAKREMLFAAKLAACRYINRYIGWVFCRRELMKKTSFYTRHMPSLYIIQRYVPNGDARGYLEKRESSFKPQEVLQASICLFAALTDAHALNIGIVDLKLENFLIDSSGAGWLTDFGSCIEFKEGNEAVDLDEEKVAWTEHVAPPEMLQKHIFTKASDVFMATLIIAELMTADVSDVDFQNNILQRCERTGKVSFSSAPIDPVYKDFFTLLKMGLHNNPNQRPTAKAILDYLLVMRG
ncbi:kinase-like domain-containing protein [Mucor lusitanicus]|uniref:Protein kinase domain-containing protein n=1 Tax=Mucor lusitanicus CBS 277.49 TaxID=747725 RepID=A0A168K697_MUCCL|nr:hypothetical protein MUCCIDRAFT_163985 [Mucor lusitanicus CBS 277.49]